LFGKLFKALTCREVYEKLEAVNGFDCVRFKELLEKYKFHEELLFHLVGVL
jgi:hypothetical protein